MKGLTSKEEEIMGFFWEKGPLFVKQMLAFYEDPKPHFNTLSTIVRGLEEKGYLAHEVYGEHLSILRDHQRRRIPQRHLEERDQQIFQQLVPQCCIFTRAGGGHFIGRIETTHFRGRKSTR